MQVQRLQNNSYKPNFNTPRFCGTANLQKLRQLVNVAEPEIVKDVIKGNFDEYVKWWIKTPDNELKKMFSYDDLNSYLMHKNIRVLLDKRGAFHYDVDDLLTDDNYELAVQLAKNPNMPLFKMRGLLSVVNEDKSQFESMLKLSKSECQNVSNKSNPNSNFGKLIFDRDSHVGHFGRGISGYFNNEKYWYSFKDVALEIKANKEIKKLCDYLRECQQNLVVSLDGAEDNLYLELRTEADSGYDAIYTGLKATDLTNFKSDSIILEHKKGLNHMKALSKKLPSNEVRSLWIRHNHFTGEKVLPKSKKLDGTYNFSST